MKHFTKWKLITLILASSFLISCGGGGEGGSTSSKKSDNKYITLSSTIETDSLLNQFEITVNASQLLTLKMSGSCGNFSTDLVEGDNPISIPLAEGEYSNCSVIAYLGDDQVDEIIIPSFTIDTTSPSIESDINPDSYIDSPQLTLSLTSDEDGFLQTIGDCEQRESDSHIVSKGLNQFYLMTEEEKTYSNCAFYVEDVAGNPSNTINISNFTVDLSVPTISLITNVPVRTNQHPYNFEISSSEAGQLTSNCPLQIGVASKGINTLRLNTPTVSAVSQCSITITDFAGNQSSLDFPGIAIDAVKPIITAYDISPSASTRGELDINISMNEPFLVNVSGACVSETTTVFDSLSEHDIDIAIEVQDGIYSDQNCIITVSDIFLNTLPPLSFDNVVVDSSAPIVSVSELSGALNINTPSITINSNELATLQTRGDCNISSNNISPGVNTLSLNPLQDGNYNNCRITVTDINGNTSESLSLGSFSIDTTGPVLSQLEPFIDRTSNKQPSVFISSNEDYTFSLTGGCSASQSSGSAGENLIQLNEILIGSYECGITARDVLGNESILPLETFVIIPDDVTITAFYDSTDSIIKPAINSSALLYRSEEGECDVTNYQACSNGQVDNLTNDIIDTTFTRLASNNAHMILVQDEYETYEKKLGAFKIPELFAQDKLWDFSSDGFSYSENGHDWVEINMTPGYGDLSDFQTIEFQGLIFLVGGHNNSQLSQYTNNYWVSPNGRFWANMFSIYDKDNITHELNPSRHLILIVHDEKLYAISQTPNTAYGVETWVTEDGENWDYVGHYQLSTVEFDGGFSSNGELVAYMNVSNSTYFFASSDGTDWKQVHDSYYEEQYAVAKNIPGRPYSINGMEISGNMITDELGTVTNRYSHPQNLPLTEQPSFVSHGGKLWSIGGYGKDRSADIIQRNREIWSSTNGYLWSYEGEANFPARYKAEAISFNDKLFIFGGDTEGGLPLNGSGIWSGAVSAAGNSDEIWSSNDGITWTLEGFGPFARSGYHRVTELDGVLYLYDGSEVWKSNNGIDWSRSSSKVFDNNNNFRGDIVAYDGRLYVFVLSTVSVSEDGGETWVDSSNPEGRYYNQVIVAGEKLWMTNASYIMCESVNGVDWSNCKFDLLGIQTPSDTYSIYIQAIGSDIYIYSSVWGDDNLDPMQVFHFDINDANLRTVKNFLLRYK